MEQSAQTSMRFVVWRVQGNYSDYILTVSVNVINYYVLFDVFVAFIIAEVVYLEAGS